MVKVKENIPPLIAGTKKLTDTDKIVSEVFRRFFTSFSKSINKQENRTGSLFQKNFKRIAITEEAYFTRLVYYIHANPETHGLVNDFRNYHHSSYNRMLLDKPSKLHKAEVLNWFGSKQDFIYFHSSLQQIESLKSYLIEDGPGQMP
ncbi:MAG: hypothetical protein LPJ89_00455 [Hymenobacteraceae bacterium]|nr:hypothetical protein [Hymenobacteraceae bacterium]